MCRPPLSLGIALLGVALAPLSFANIVFNPGFEAGGAQCSGAAECNPIEGPWVFTDAASGSDYGVDNFNPHSGTFSALFGGTTEGVFDSIQQTLTTVASSTYDLSFWLDTHFDHSDADFQVFWNGNLVYDDPAGTDLAHQFPYTQITIPSLLATGSSTILLFQGFNLPSFDYLDDVNVVASSAVPEPATWMLAGLGLAAALAARKLKAR